MIRFLYQNIFKPIAFSLDAEFVHNRITNLGEFLENCGPLVSLLSYQNNKLKKRVLGIDFDNPIGLSAGFDYNGHMAKVLKYVGFGFNTVGTITARPHQGNSYPRLGRLPKSKSLLVNKGFKNDGAQAVAARLDKKDLRGHTIGISVGSVTDKIDDYLFVFDTFKNKKYVSYFELNISCPNIAVKINFKELAGAVALLKLKQPIFIKMPNGVNTNELVKTALGVGIRGFIFSNLVKNRNNPTFNKEEIAKFESFKGNFSGKPTFENSNKQITHARKTFGKDIAIIGVGGVFNAQDAKEKFAAGADLVQLITGMIFEGPQLVGEICKEIVT